MKKIKILLNLMIVALVLTISTSVYATTKITRADIAGNSQIYVKDIAQISGNVNEKTAKVTSGEILTDSSISKLYYQMVDLSISEYNNIKTKLETLNTSVKNYNSNKTEENYNTYLKADDEYIKSLLDYNDSKWVQTTGSFAGATVKVASDSYIYEILWTKGITTENKTVYQPILLSSKITSASTDTGDNSNNGEDKKEEPTTDKSTDFSNAKIKFETTSTGEFKFYKLVFDNVTYKDKANYYVYITHSKNKPNIEYGSNGKPSNPDGSIYKEDNTYVKENKKISALLEEYGDIYVWVVEYDNTTGKSQICLSNKKVDRPKLNSIGNRLKGYFFNDKTNIFCYEDKDDSIKRKMNVKIGVVKDIEILKSIQKGESDSLSKLMDYAKANKPKYTTTFDIKGATNSLESIAKKIGLTNREYYYVYMYLDDEDNKYYGIEDVSLYQASIGESIGYNLFDYLSDEFKWNLKDSNKKGNTTSNTDNTTSNKPIPFTGTSIAVITLLVVLLISALVFYYKNQKYKDVK